MSTFRLSTPRVIIVTALAFTLLTFGICRAWFVRHIHTISETKTSTLPLTYAGDYREGIQAPNVGFVSAKVVWPQGDIGYIDARDGVRLCQDVFIPYSWQFGYSLESTAEIEQGVAKAAVWEKGSLDPIQCFEGQPNIIGE